MMATVFNTIKPYRDIDDTPAVDECCTNFLMCSVVTQRIQSGIPELQVF